MILLPLLTVLPSITPPLPHCVMAALRKCQDSNNLTCKSKGAETTLFLCCSWRTAASSVPPTPPTSGRVWCPTGTAWRRPTSPSPVQTDSPPCRTPRNLDSSSERGTAVREDKVQMEQRKIWTHPFSIILMTRIDNERRTETKELCFFVSRWVLWCFYSLTDSSPCSDTFIVSGCF